MICTILKQEQWERVAPELPGKVGDPGRSAHLTIVLFVRSGLVDRANRGAVA